MATILENDGQFFIFNFIFLRLSKSKVKSPFKLYCKINHWRVPIGGALKIVSL